jgi:putative DNA primase/helicase
VPIGKDASDWLAAGGACDELMALAKSAEEWKPKPSIAPAVAVPTADLRVAEGRTDAANAMRLVARYGDVIRWCDPWNKWLVWDGKRWKVDDSRHVEALAKCMANDLWQEAATLAKTSDDATIKAMWKFIRASNQANGIRNTVALARCEVAILPGALDTHPWLLNVENGTLDLQTGTLRPPDKADFLTQLCPVPYEPDAKFPAWRSFVHTVLGGDMPLVSYVQRLVGYCLTGSTREHLLPFLFGVGANGKSTFVSTVLAMLGEDYTIKAPTDLLLAKHDTHPTERADLYGKRFVACVEAEDGRRLAESLVKELTGGDRVRARRMREDFWEFTATHKIWLAANHKPTVRGTDHGIWRRIKLLPFTVVIPDDQQDKDLPATLLAELPGILAWAVEGCRQWQQVGLQEPEVVRAATGDYRHEMDLVGRFLAECCIVDPDSIESASTLYAQYREWCDKTGERCVNQTRFGSQLTERGLAGEKIGEIWEVGGYGTTTHCAPKGGKDVADPTIRPPTS